MRRDLMISSEARVKDPVVSVSDEPRASRAACSSLDCCECSLPRFLMAVVAELFSIVVGRRVTTGDCRCYNPKRSYSLDKWEISMDTDYCLLFRTLSAWE